MRPEDEIKVIPDQGVDLAYCYEKYTYAMLHIASCYIKDFTIAEDIVQTVFEKLLTKKQYLHFENEEMCKSFIFKAVKNQCIDFLRLEKKRLDMKENAETSVDERDFIVDSPLSEILRKEECEDLRWLIENKLESQYRIALYCHYFFELSMKEIGELMDVDQKTVAVWAFRARKLLKEWILKEREEEEKRDHKVQKDEEVQEDQKDQGKED